MSGVHQQMFLVFFFSLWAGLWLLLLCPQVVAWLLVFSKGYFHFFVRYSFA